MADHTKQTVGLIELVLPRHAVDKRTQPKSGQLWHDLGRQIEGLEDLRDGIRLDLCLVLLWRHLDGLLALEGRRVGGDGVVKGEQQTSANPNMCALKSLGC